MTAVFPNINVADVVCRCLPDEDIIKYFYIPSVRAEIVMNICKYSTKESRTSAMGT